MNSSSSPSSSSSSSTSDSVESKSASAGVVVFISSVVVDNVVVGGSVVLTFALANWEYRCLARSLASAICSGVSLLPELEKVVIRILSNYMKLLTFQLGKYRAIFLVPYDALEHL